MVRLVLARYGVVLVRRMGTRQAGWGEVSSGEVG
jgi:hypothetical protein